MEPFLGPTTLEKFSALNVKVAQAVFQRLRFATFIVTEKDVKRL